MVVVTGHQYTCARCNQLGPWSATTALRNVYIHQKIVRRDMNFPVIGPIITAV